MFEVVNKDRHISSDVAETCIKIGGVIDKVFCGNGFTTAYSNIINNTELPDVLIVPNISTAVDKKTNSRFAKGKRVLYFHSKSSDIVPADFSNIDLLVCVADSYVHKELYKIECRYILLDEVHTAKIQSGFRPILYKLFEVLKPKRNVSFVTATPYNIDGVNVTINNTNEHFKELKTVDISYSADRTIKELQNTKGRVLIATNEARRIGYILKSIGVNDVNLMVGKGFRKSFLSNGTFNITEDARHTIMSTSAFEGHDINTPDVSVFVFQNYDSQHTQFLDSQIIQAFGRARMKPKQLQICWLGGASGKRTSKTTLKYKDEIKNVCEKYCHVFNNTKTKRVEAEDFVFRYKNDNIRLGSIRELIIFEDSECNQKRTAKVNYLACDVLKNKLNVSSDGMNVRYFNTRGFILNEYEDKPTSVNKIPPAGIIKKTKNLIYNREHNPDYISKSELVKWCFDIDITAPILKIYSLVKEYLKEDTPTRLDKFFSGFIGFENIFRFCIKKIKEKHQKKRKKMPSLDHLKDEIFSIIVSFIKISRPQEKIRAFRNYNPFTSVGSVVIDYLSSLFGMRKISFDITACASTVIQALAGCERKDVYEVGAKRKDSKIKINKLLNSIYKVNGHSSEILKELKKTKFSDKAFQLIKDRFYRTNESNLFINTYTIHERNIIEQAIRIVKTYINSDTLIVSRHDEINIFYSDETEDSIKLLEDGLGQRLANIDYLGFNNWFGYGAKKSENNVKNDSRKTPKKYTQMELVF